MSEPLTASLLLDSPRVSAPMRAGGAVAAGLPRPRFRRRGPPGRRGELGPSWFRSRPDPTGAASRPCGATAARHGLLPASASLPGRTGDPGLPRPQTSSVSSGSRRSHGHAGLDPAPESRTCRRIGAGVPNRGTLSTHALAGMRPARIVRVYGFVSRRADAVLVAPGGRRRGCETVGGEFEAAGEYGPRDDDDLHPEAVAEA